MNATHVLETTIAIIIGGFALMIIFFILRHPESAYRARKINGKYGTTCFSIFVVSMLSYIAAVELNKYWETQEKKTIYAERLAYCQTNKTYIISTIGKIAKKKSLNRGIFFDQEPDENPWISTCHQIGVISLQELQIYSRRFPRPAIDANEELRRLGFPKK